MYLMSLNSCSYHVKAVFTIKVHGKNVLSKVWREILRLFQSRQILREQSFALLLLAWQCLAPSHQHVLFNNVGIFYCFAFITVREAKAENRNRKPVALKPELYRPTTLRCNMSIWIQKGGFLAGCPLNTIVFSLFPPLSKCALDFLCFSASWKTAPFLVTTHYKSGLC